MDIVYIVVKRLLTAILAFLGFDRETSGRIL